MAALFDDAASGEVDNAYALSRARPATIACRIFRTASACLNNIAIACRGRAWPRVCRERIAVIDWDVHHGNGTEAIYLRARRHAGDLDPPGAQLSPAIPEISRIAVRTPVRDTEPQHPATPGRRACDLS
jgi:hypothetical protein